MNCKIKINSKIIDILLLICIVVIVVLLVFVINKKNEHFQSNTCSLSEKIIDTWEAQEESTKDGEDELPAQNHQEMLESLIEQENLCQKLENIQENKNKERLLKLQKQKLQQIETQDKKIQMLSTMLQNLKQKQTQKNLQINQCQNSTQKQLNTDYTEVQSLTNNGLMNTDMNVNIITSPKLKNIINSLKAAKINPLLSNDPKVLISHLQTCIQRIEHKEPQIPNVTKNKLISEMKKFVKNPVGNNKSLNFIIENLNQIKDEQTRADIVRLLLSFIPKPKYESLQNK